MPMRIYLSRPHMSGREEKRVAEAFASNFVAPVGPQLDAFETSVAEYLGGDVHCVGLSSGSAHTLIPALAKKEGKIDMSFGVMGADFQPMGHVNVVVNRYIYGMDPQAALDFPRLFPRGQTVLAETPIPAPVIAGLTAKGHHIVAADEPLGGGQAIVIDHAQGVLIGGSDHRKDGFALGY